MQNSSGWTTRGGSFVPRLHATCIASFGLVLAQHAAAGDVAVSSALGDESEPMLPSTYWAKGEPRAFVTARAVLGTAYGRAAASAGYGRPYWQWIGLDGVSTLTMDSHSAQAGVRGNYMAVEGMFTLRHTYSFAHRSQRHATSFTDSMLERNGVRGAEYVALDAGAWGCIPYGSWLGAWEFDWVRPLSLGADERVLEEIQRVVIGPDGVWSIKLGLSLALSQSKRSYVGLMVEYLDLVGRQPGDVYRAGPTFWLAVTEHTEIGGYLTWPIYGPDRLGPLTGMYGAIGVQYQMASGEPRWRLP